jgi:hypothetical protein
MVFISAGAPENLRKICSTGNPAPKSICESEVRLRGSNFCWSTCKSTKDMLSRKSCSWEKYRAKLHMDTWTDIIFK